METIICTCCTSLVERVISDAVEKPLISAMEKLSTLSKTLLRIRKESADAMRAAKKPTATELSALPSAQPSMSAPFFQILSALRHARYRKLGDLCRIVGKGEIQPDLQDDEPDAEQSIHPLFPLQHF